MVTSNSPSSATLSNVLHLCSITWLSHVVQALQGQQVFSWVTRTYMERHVCYTISYSKLACGIEKGGGLKMGLGVTQNVLYWLSLLSPSSPSFYFFHFHSAKEADRSNFKPKLLVRVPKVIQHDVDDWNLIDFGSINLHHSLSIAFPCLQEKRNRRRNKTWGKKIFDDTQKNKHIDSHSLVKITAFYCDFVSGVTVLLSGNGWGT